MGLSRKQFLSVKEIAEILGCGVGEVYTAINHGDLPAFRDGLGSLEGKRLPWRVKKKDFKEWLERRSNLAYEHTSKTHGLHRLIAAITVKPLHREEEWRAAVDALWPRERHVLTRRFGLDGGHPASLFELSEELDTSRERVRQIQRSAEKQVKDIMFSDWPKTKDAGEEALPSPRVAN